MENLHFKILAKKKHCSRSLSRQQIMWPSISDLTFRASVYSDKCNGWTRKLLMSLSISKFYNSRMKNYIFENRIPRNKLFNSLPVVRFSALPK